MLIILFVAVVGHSTKQGILPTRMLDYFKSVIASTNHHSKSTYFRHLSLSEEEMKSGCRLGLDSWAGAGFSGKHAYVEKIVEGNGVNVTEFTSNLGSIDNLTISHVLYAFGKEG